ncbi:hypothetical protein B484DRAFT_339323, partial [Ochromonadaceae sp. CCMP2298]
LYIYYNVHLTHSIYTIMYIKPSIIPLFNYILCTSMVRQLLTYTYIRLYTPIPIHLYYATLLLLSFYTVLVIYIFVMYMYVMYKCYVYMLCMIRHMM